MKITDTILERMQLESFNFRYAVERISAQLKFAADLKELHPEHAAAWEPLIAQATAELEQFTPHGDEEARRAAISRAERILNPLAEVAKRYTVHCVGHAHIDMNWMWSWPETVAATNDTFNTVLRLMEEYPDFVFSQSQASIYAIIEEFNPEMLAQIRRRVQEKRWEITASHWVENDKNMSGGEALTRHLLYTRRYMKKLFGLAPEDVMIDWAPDTFGHAATVPSYLVRGGVKYCYLHRPGNETDPKPGAFWWQSPDGSRILVRNDMRNGYNGRVGSDLAEKMTEFVKETGGNHFMFVYGIGDHGGGPTRCDLNRIVDMSSWPIFPQVKFSTARAFFDALATEASRLPVLTGELNVEFTGCYTTQSQIKKANRYSENRLADAEFAAALDWKLRQTPYPAEKLEKFWRQCLFNQFHDILPGSGVRATRHYTMGHFQDLLATTGMMETLSLRQLAGMISTEVAAGKENAAAQLHHFFRQDAFGAGVGSGTGDGSISKAGQIGQGDRPFVIFNPLEKERCEVVEVTVWDNPRPGDTTELKDRKFAVIMPDGKRHSVQFMSSGHEWGHRYVRLALPPVTVAGFGYTVCTITEAEPDVTSTPQLKPLQPSHHCGYSYHERMTRFGGENQYVELEINPVTGGILRLRDKTSGRDIISPDDQAPMLEYAVERPRPMSAWLIEHSSSPEPVQIKSITTDASGPYLTRIKVEAEIHRSQFTVCYEITAGNPMVAVHIRGNWLEAGNKTVGTPTLRLPLPLNMDQPQAVYEIPFGAVTRDLCHDEEVPALQWVKVSDGTAGVLLVNDCKYGFALDGSTLRTSLIRSSFEPDANPELGEHEIHLGLLPFSGGFSDAQATRFGRDFNHRLKIIGTDPHPGRLPQTGSFIRLLTDDVVVSGLKKAEDGEALIIRLYETAGKAKTVKIVFDRSMGEIAEAEEVDLMERPVKGGHRPAITADMIEMEMPPFALISVKIAFR